MIAIRAFVGHLFGVDVTFEDKLTIGGHLQVIAEALHQLGFFTTQQTGKSVFTECVGHRRHRPKGRRGIGPQRNGNGKTLTRVLLLELLKIQRAAAVR